MINLDSIFKSRDITLPTKVRLVKAMVFPVVMHGCESWTVKKAERRRIDAFELWCWRRLLRVPWTARRSNHSILKEISPGCSLEGLMLKLKLQYFGHLMGRVDLLGKTVMLGGAGSRHIAYWVHIVYCILSAALSTASSFRIWNSSTGILSLSGASVRSSTHDQGHEEGGSAYVKAGSSLRSPPGNSRASTPKIRVCLLSALCFHLHLWLYGGLSPTTSLWKKS